MTTGQKPHAQHLEVARQAGLPKISGVSVLAGLITAYGAFAIVAAIAGSILAAADVDTDFRTNDWSGSGAVASLASAVVLLIAYLFGGYVAGRMARRASMLHGLVVFVASLVVGGVVGGVVAALTDDQSIRSNLRSIGVPTGWSQVNDVAVAGVLVSVVAMFVGSLLGAMWGERWHTKLARRAADPEIGPAAQAQRRADAERQRTRELRPDEGAGTTYGTAWAHDGDQVIDLDREAQRTDQDEPRYTEAEWRARSADAKVGSEGSVPSGTRRWQDPSSR